MKKIISFVSLLSLLLFVSCKNYKTPYEKIYEKRAIERKYNEAGQSILYGKIQIEKISTGFLHRYSDIFAPCIALKIKNISNGELRENIKISSVFLDNKTGEQIADDYSYVRTFIQDATMQIRMWSSTGFSISTINDKDISVRLYVNDKYLQTIKIQNIEFDGDVD